MTILSLVRGGMYVHCGSIGVIAWLLSQRFFASILLLLDYFEPAQMVEAKVVGATDERRQPRFRHQRTKAKLPFMFGNFVPVNLFNYR